MALVLREAEGDRVLVRIEVTEGLVVPFIERSYTLKQVPDALRYMATGHAQGKLVISV